MVISLQLDQASEKRLRRMSEAGANADAILGKSLEAALATGAQEVAQWLQEGHSGLTMQHPASGLAASVAGWLESPAALTGFLGVPGNSPAAQYAGILERGGKILPKNAKALAVPISAEAKSHTSPRDMADLTFIPRKGKPPLLVRLIGGQHERMEVHWVLLSSVTIPAFRWLTQGASAAQGAMADAMNHVLHEGLA